MSPLLQQREALRKAARLEQWRQARERLAACLGRHLRGQRIWLFGSITEPGRFNAASDVDIAIDALPDGVSIYTLTALLEEEMKRPVDVAYLPESRLRDKIISQGELWTV